MPDDRTVLYSLVAVALILLLVLVYNNQRARLEREKKDEDDQSVSPLLSRFVRHEGSVVGETVAFDGDLLILKQAGVFKAVPRDKAYPVGDEVELMGEVDWTAAVSAGTAWHERSTKGVDEGVTSDLTKSEDVRKPALEALKEREGEEE